MPGTIRNREKTDRLLSSLPGGSLSETHQLLSEFENRFYAGCREASGLREIRPSASAAAELLHRLFQDGRNVDSIVGGTRKNDAQLVVLIREQHDGLWPRRDPEGKLL